MGLPQIGTEMIRFPHRKFGQWLASIVLMPSLTTYYIHSYRRRVHYWYRILSLHTWAVDIFSRELVLVTAHFGGYKHQSWTQTLLLDRLMCVHPPGVLHYLFVDLYDMRCRYLYLYLNACMPSLINPIASYAPFHFATCAKFNPLYPCI
jgi:hypothetical protein